MRFLLIGIAAVTTFAASSPVPAQTPSPVWPSAAYPSAYQDYSPVALTPWDAYKQGMINRWELEQLQGPTPQALQGPSPHAKTGSGGGGN